MYTSSGIQTFSKGRGGGSRAIKARGGYQTAFLPFCCPYWGICRFLKLPSEKALTWHFFPTMACAALPSSSCMRWFRADFSSLQPAGFSVTEVLCPLPAATLVWRLLQRFPSFWASDSLHSGLCCVLLSVLWSDTPVLEQGLEHTVLPLSLLTLSGPLQHGAPYMQWRTGRDLSC